MKYDYDTLFGTKKLVLFDIDGTLVNILDMHIDILTEAYSKHAGITVENRTAVSKHFGLPSHDMARSFLVENGVHKPHQTMITNIIDHHRNGIADRHHTISHEHVIPGIIPLLEHLKKDHKMIMTITGGTRPMSSILLQRANLLSFLDDTIFSDDLYKGNSISKRSQMIEIAFERAKEKIPELKREDVIVIGDTPSDVIAAKEAGVDSIGVGTGSHSREDVERHHPTFWVEHF